MITSLFHWLTQSSIFTKLNLNFGILSLNVWGIWSFDKLKALFHWFMKDKANIIFLQETYSTPEVENVWKYQWRGELFFGHGSEHSRGVLTLVKEGLDCKLKVWKQDDWVIILFWKVLCTVNLLFSQISTWMLRTRSMSNASVFMMSFKMSNW